MPSPSAIMAGASAVQSIPQLMLGLSQRNEAKNLERSEFIPQALRQKKKYDQILASATQVPGQEYAEQEIDQSLASAVNQARKSTRSSGDLLNTVGAVQQQGANQKQELAANVQGQLMDNDRQLTNTLLRVASQQQQNQRDFEQRKQQLMNASSQNLYGGVTSLGEGGAAIADYRQQVDSQQEAGDSGGGNSSSSQKKTPPRGFHSTMKRDLKKMNNQLAGMVLRSGGRYN